MEGKILCTSGKTVTGVKQSIQTKPYPGANRSTKNPKWIGFGSNMGFHGDRPAANHL